MSTSRKEIRDWFGKALNGHLSELGKVYTTRMILFNDNAEPEKFVNVYIESGEIRNGEQGLGPLNYSVCEIGFHSKKGDDDDLDHMEFISDRAIDQYRQIMPPGFDFYKQRYTYQGTDEDKYRSLFITYEIVSR